MENLLVSIGVFSYNNTHYLYECLDSVFAQTYENIELIISNDCSDCFDVEAVQRYVDENATANFKNIIINKNERNLGTVKHCNVVLDLCNGEYVTFISCDDLYNNNHVIKDAVKSFEAVPHDVMHLVWQWEMYNDNLTISYGNYLSEEEISIINKSSPYELYRNHLLLKCLMPAGGLYKKEVFDKYGKFDEKYFIVEDWTSQISFARQGMRSYCVDIIAINHRKGGVSYSDLDAESYAHKMFTLDIINLRKDILEHGTGIDDAVLNELKIAHDDWVRRFLEIWGGIHKYQPRKGVVVPPIVVFGAGSMGKSCSYKFDGISIKYYVDNDFTKHNDMIDSIPIKSPEVLSVDKGDYVVVIAIMEKYNEVKNQLLKLGVDCEKIFAYSEFCDSFFVSAEGNERIDLVCNE